MNLRSRARARVCVCGRANDGSESGRMRTGKRRSSRCDMCIQVNPSPITVVHAHHWRCSASPNRTLTHTHTHTYTLHQRGDGVCVGGGVAHRPAASQFLNTHSDTETDTDIARKDSDYLVCVCVCRLQCMSVHQCRPSIMWPSRRSVVLLHLGFLLSLSPSL